MYQALLTRRYLTTKIMPVLSIVAVMLCVAMVLIVWSVMGGFLNMLLGTGRSLIGDVRINWPTTGFGHYDELIARLEADPLVHAASPTIETFGMLSLPDGRVLGVWVKGVQGEGYSRVTDYERSLWWRPLGAGQGDPRDTSDLDPRTKPENQDELTRMLEHGRLLREVDARTGVVRPALVPGIEVTGFSSREPEGYYVPKPLLRPGEDGSTTVVSGFLPAQSLTLSVLPVDSRGRSIETVTRVFPVANEFRTEIYEIDNKTVLLELSALQAMLKMDAARRIDPSSAGVYDTSVAPDGSESFSEHARLEEVPARATTVLVRARPGVTPERLRERCREIYADFARDFAGKVPGPEVMLGSGRIETWEADQAAFIGAVRKETALVLFLLVIISLTAVFLILAIFWAMVSEKTKDIGVLRSIGASREGVAWIWLRYGGAIGVIGSLLGGAAAYVIVLNINPIHEWMGRSLGLYVWDPKVYYFSRIPSEVEPWKAALVLGCGVAFSVAGALIPALRAANMHPVRALRFE